MKPGAWVLLGHAGVKREPVEDALTALKTLAYGGTLLDDEQAETLLTRAGLGGGALGAHAAGRTLRQGRSGSELAADAGGPGTLAFMRRVTDPVTSARRTTLGGTCIAS